MFYLSQHSELSFFKTSEPVPDTLGVSVKLT